ncbi:MAG: response regulator [Bacteroidota bacterium]
MSNAGTKDLVRIALAEDDLSVCELVSNHINTLENCKVVIQAADGQELLDKMKSKAHIDVAILDIMMAGMDGYTAASIIRNEYPAVRILFYSMCKSEIALAMMMASGGHGLIKKGESSLQIHKAIRTVMEGYYFFPGTRKKIIINGDDYSGGKHKKITAVSPAEITFLRLIGTEKTYKEIADHLQISPRKADYMRERLFRDLEVKNRAELAILAYEGGLLPVKEE